MPGDRIAHAHDSAGPIARRDLIANVIVPARAAGRREAKYLEARIDLARRLQRANRSHLGGNRRLCCSAGDAQADGRALAEDAFRPDRAAMLRDNLANDRKAEPGSEAARAEQRLENLR